MSEMKLNLEINQEFVAMFDKARSVWKQDHIKNKMKDYFLTTIEKKFSDAYWKWDGLIEEVVNSIPSSEDSDHLLSYVIKQTGQRIDHWFHYMWNICASEPFSNPDELEKGKCFGLTNEAFVNYCIDEIHWTEYGTVDKVKTFSSVWVNISEIDYFKKFLFACHLCDKPLIDVLWNKLPKDKKESDHSSYFKGFRLPIIAYWISLKKSTLETFIKDINHIKDDKYFDEKRSLEENFINHMIKSYDVNHLIATYFLEKLSNEKLQENAPVWFKNFARLGRSYVNNVIHILLFLYNAMSEDAKKTAFNNQNKYMLYDSGTAVMFLELLHSVYPFYDLLGPALTQLQPYLINSDYAKVFNLVVTSTFLYDEKIDNILKGKLHELWNIIPKTTKEPVANKILPTLFKIWDFQNLKVILNDKNLSEEREKLLRIGYKNFIDLVWENKLDMINPFVEEILISSENEIKGKVKKMFKILLVDLDIKAAEEYVNSQFVSEEDKKNFMKKINHEILIFFFLGKQRMDLIVEYFEKLYPDDLKAFKETIKKNTFTLDSICEIWLPSKGPVHESPEKFCNEFLLWLFDSNSDGANDFRKSVLLKYLKAHGWTKLNDLFDESNRFEILRELLLWCFCTEKEVKKVKSDLLGYAVPGKFIKLIEDDRLDICKKLLDWCFKSEKNKRKFKSKFIGSKKGIAALRTLIGTMKSEESDPELIAQDISRRLKDYLNFWIESLEDMIMVRRCLKEVRENESKNKKKKRKGNKMKLDSDGDSTTFEETEAESSEEENNYDSYFYYDSVSFEMHCYNKNVVMDEKNLELFLCLLEENIKEKLDSMNV